MTSSSALLVKDERPGPSTRKCLGLALVGRSAGAERGAGGSGWAAGGGQLRPQPRPPQAAGWRSAPAGPDHLAKDHPNPPSTPRLQKWTQNPGWGLQRWPGFSVQPAEAEPPLCMGHPQQAVPQFLVQPVCVASVPQNTDPPWAPSETRVDRRVGRVSFTWAGGAHWGFLQSTYSTLLLRCVASRSWWKFALGSLQ